MKISSAFSLVPLWQFSSHKSVFFDRKFGSKTGQLAVTGNCTGGSNPTFSAIYI
jgi:hypothetical protein